MIFIVSSIYRVYQGKFQKMITISRYFSYGFIGLDKFEKIFTGQMIQGINRIPQEFAMLTNVETQPS